MTAADIRVSLFANAKANTGGEISFADVAERITGGTYAAQVAAIRTAPDDLTAKARKTMLPGFTPSGTFGVRNRNGLKSHSGIVHADFDDLTTEQIAAVKAKAANDPHCLFVFVSPSGNGVKAFFVCDATRPHPDSWAAMRAHCLATYGHEPDPATKDVTRLCFFSADPEAYVAGGEVLPLPPLAPATEKEEPEPETGSEDAGEEYPPLNVEQVRELLKSIPTRPPEWKWKRIIGMVAKTLSESEGLPLLKAWSPEEKSGEYEEWWGYVTDYGPGSLVKLAREHGWKKSKAYEAAERAAREKMYRDKLRERLHAREFGNGPEPVKPTPRFLVAGIATSTPGNLTSVFAQAKTGKSSLLAAHIAAAIVAETGAMGCDCLGVTAAEPGGRVLLHIDTEQSVYDHYQQIRRALARAGVTERPSWLRSFQLAGCGARELVESVRLLCDDEAAKGGIFAVIIDGIADLTVSVNDEEDCNALVAGLHDLAIRHDCPILCVLHENPAQNTGKQRGHLGSQLERKAETNLRLKREGEVTTVYADKTRGAPIPEKHGPRFQWSDDLGMHVSIESAATTQEDEKTAELRELAEECVADVEAQALTHSAWVARIRELRGVAKSTAERKLKDMQKTGIIRKDPGSKFWRYVSAT